MGKGCFIAGQISCIVKKEEGAKEIIDDVILGAEKLLTGVNLDI